MWEQCRLPKGKYTINLIKLESSVFMNEIISNTVSAVKVRVESGRSLKLTVNLKLT